MSKSAEHRTATVAVSDTLRRATLEAEGATYAVRVLNKASTDEESLSELGKVAKRLTKKKGGRDAA